MKKIIITILLLLIASPIQAILYNENGFIFSGSAENGWMLITPTEDYFGFWLRENVLGSISIDKETRIADCWLIEKGSEEKCSLQDFSILLTKFPYELIEDLKQ